MSLLDAATLLLALAAGFGLINHHVFKLPFAIGLLVSGLLASLGVVVADRLLPALSLVERVREVVLGIDFADTVLNGMLSLLLFAGAMHTDISKLKQRVGVIVSLATVGVVISATVAGGIAYWLFNAFGIDVPLVWCMAFGALISPTDPIAVLGVMKAAKAPKSLETKVIGESLFNDGTGVILFTVMVGLGTATATGGAVDVGTEEVVKLLVQEILGGILLGLVAGYICFRAFKTIDEPNLEILMTVATVFVTGTLSIKFHLSGPLAAVSAGLFIGNRGRMEAMSPTTAQNLDVVWTFIDEMLNAVLFLLIGLEVFAIDTSERYLLAGFALIPGIILARLVGVELSVLAMRIKREIDLKTVGVLTWGGLRGGVSVALAMKLPEFEGRSAVLTATYMIVIFSIVVQGLSIGRMLRWLYPAGEGAAGDASEASEAA